LFLSGGHLADYPPMADNLKHVELIETPTFTRQITALLSDKDYGAFQPRVAAEYARSAWQLDRAASAGVPA
jgi:hypothetical protein